MKTILSTTLFVFLCSAFCSAQSTTKKEVMQISSSKNVTVTKTTVIKTDTSAASQNEKATATQKEVNYSSKNVPAKSQNIVFTGKSPVTDVKKKTGVVSYSKDKNLK